SIFAWPLAERRTCRRYPSPLKSLPVFVYFRRYFGNISERNHFIKRIRVNSGWARGFLFLSLRLILPPVHLRRIFLQCSALNSILLISVHVLNRKSDRKKKISEAFYIQIVHHENWKTVANCNESFANVS
ncbi:hypothetical protein CEXT_722971, partial [Caerostris extrusa]